MGMSIRAIYSDGSMSPECPTHGSDPEEGCESCIAVAQGLAAVMDGSDWVDDDDL